METGTWQGSKVAEARGPQTSDSLRLLGSCKRLVLSALLRKMFIFLVFYVRRRSSQFTAQIKINWPE